MCWRHFLVIPGARLSTFRRQLFGNDHGGTQALEYSIIYCGITHGRVRVSVHPGEHHTAPGGCWILDGGCAEPHSSSNANTTGLDSRADGTRRAGTLSAALAVDARWIIL